MKRGMRSGLPGMAVAALLITTSGQAAPLDLADQPLNLTEGVPPNLMITLDDSGSMASQLCYDDAVEYPYPLDASGAERFTDNSFSSAYGNPYTNPGWRVDLDGQNWFDCSGGWFTASDQWSAARQQNFANFIAFHRTRNLTTITGASIAFTDVSAETRVGWQRLNTCDNGIGQGCASGVRAFDTTQRSDFYTWLDNLPSSGGTPLRAAVQRAGDYFETQEPYEKVPGTTTQPQHSCRKNFHVVMTDGIWNGGLNNGPGNDDNPSSSHTLPNGGTYSGRPPYKDDNSNSLSDLTFHYWRRDLRPNLADNVKAVTPVTTGTAEDIFWNPRNDPADWQHLVTFTVGLQLADKLDLSGREWGGSTFAPDFDEFEDSASPADWPSTGSNRDPANVYDLWHAAVNSRGRFFGASDPASLGQAFRDILLQIEKEDGSSTAVAVSGSAVQTSDRTFTAGFNSGTWAGTVFATDRTTGSVIWDAACQLDGGNCPTANGQATTPTIAPADRQVVTLVPQGGTQPPAGEPFRWANLTATQQAYLDPTGDGLGDERLAFLRGDRSEESQNGGPFRERASALGDIVHSSPVFVGPPDNIYPARGGWENIRHGTTNLPENASGAESYLDFKASTAGGQGDRDEVVFAGANDGMLHAFDAETGNELFAYVPSAVLPDIAELTDPTYVHQYYVDGTPTVEDVFFDDDDQTWRTVLVSGLRGGGASVFALDVTNPAGWTSETAVADNVLWEFTDPDLGQTYSKPQVVRLNNGEWAAVFGNGYNGADSAILYVVDIEDGSLLAKLDTGASSGGTTPNGLATPNMVDTDGDLIADYAYAGDLEGNLWKFDLRNTNASQWSVWDGDQRQGSPGDNPIFRARDANGDVQPITQQVQTRPHPLRQGTLIVFGTGKFIEESDRVADTSVVHSIYGVWDKSNGDSSGFTRDHLLEQTIDSETAASGRTVRLVSDEPMKWYQSDDLPATPNPSAYLGWYLDLRVQGQSPVGEMQVADPLLVGGQIVFTTLIPNNDPCTAGGESYAMSVSSNSGGRLSFSAFDVNDDGSFDNADRVSSEYASGINLGKGILSTPVIAAPLNANPPGTSPDNTVRAFFGNSQGNCTQAQGAECALMQLEPKRKQRESWREIR